MGILALLLLFFNILGRPQKQQPQEKTYIMEELVIGDVKISFVTATLSLSLITDERFLALQPKDQEYILRLKEQIQDGVLAKNLIRFNPAFDLSTSTPKIYIKTKNTGEVLDIYATNIEFRWLVTDNNIIYQRYLRSVTSLPMLRFRIRPSIGPSGASVSLRCVKDAPLDDDTICESLFMHNLAFTFPIEVVEILSPVPPEIKNLP